MLKRISLVIGVSAIALAGCNEHPLKRVELDRTEIDDDLFPTSSVRAVDVLFVIDNSGSMADEQATLAQNFGAFVEALERYDLDYRIGITTSDDGHPFLPAGCQKHAGRLRLTSCLDPSRRSDFVGHDDTDAFEAACASICEFESIETLPTPIREDPNPQPRPWIQSSGGVTNLPEGITPTDALKCFGPQGIGGCGFEAPLAAMEKAVSRSGSVDEEHHGFLRREALLAVVFVTDEEDCSPQWDAAFRPGWVSAELDGTEAFWSEANKEAVPKSPTSEICWFAGVECSGGPGTYEDCQPANFDINGQPSSDDDAMLVPIDKYRDFLTNLEEQRKKLDPLAERKVLVGVIAGVPRGYSAGDSEITYADGTGDAEFERQHGIGPGCSSDAGKATPPVRLKAIAEAFAPPDRDPGVLNSICEDSYAAALEDLVKELGEVLPPPCYPRCAADEEPEEGLQPLCVATEYYLDENGKDERRAVPECDETSQGPAVPSGHEVCWRAITGDERSPECLESNLEFDFVRNGEVPLGSRMELACEVSSNPAADCEGLDVAD